MLKRLIVGLVLGAVIGVVAAVALVQGLGMSFVGSGGAVLAYVSAAVTGVLTGFIAGKPIWSADGKIEAGLKAFFGAVLALGGMFAIRRWLHLEVDLAALKAGAGSVGDLPAASLPLIAAVLGAFFEIDNTPAPKLEAAGAKAQASSANGAKKRVATEDADDADEPEESAPKKQKR